MSGRTHTNTNIQPSQAQMSQLHQPRGQCINRESNAQQSEQSLPFPNQTQSIYFHNVNRFAVPLQQSQMNSNQQQHRFHDVSRFSTPLQPTTTPIQSMPTLINAYGTTSVQQISLPNTVTQGNTNAYINTDRMQSMQPNPHLVNRFAVQLPTTSAPMPTLANAQAGIASQQAMLGAGFARSYSNIGPNQPQISQTEEPLSQFINCFSNAQEPEQLMPMHFQMIENLTKKLQEKDLELNILKSQLSKLKQENASLRMTARTQEDCNQVSNEFHEDGRSYEELETE